MEMKHWIALGGGGVIFIIVAFLIGARLAQAEKITEFPRPFFIGGTEVSGLSYEKARFKVQKSVTEFMRKGITLQIENDGKYSLPLIVKNEPLFIVDVGETMKNARAVAERGIFARWWAKVIAWMDDAETERVNWVVVDTPRTPTLLGDAINALQLPFQKPVDARFNYAVLAEGGVLRATVAPAVDGRGISVDDVTREIFLALINNETNIKITPQLTRAFVQTKDADDLVDKAERLVSAIPYFPDTFFLTIEKIKIPIPHYVLATTVQPLKIGGGNIDLGVDPEVLQKALSAQLAPFEKQGSNAVFERDGNRVKKFVPDTKGVAVDWSGTATDIFNALSSGITSATVAVRTTETEPEITLAALNDLGIKEEIGYGTSEAKGSTSNRLHNITTGMSKINGALIAPGETFSLIGALGKIDNTTGFTKELVIKDNKTQPEFGGGLCQIGTTTFRAAMGAGFPIVERRNHSYQVGYYFENGVSGTDATIYDPKPDFRFINDTGHWVMLQTRISGVKLTFTFWGTRDGRTWSRTIPKISNLVAPPPKQTIETTDLPVGKVKCTEKAHTGASAVFTYVVTYPDGAVKTQDFKSVYKPWGEVCMIGVAATSTSSGVLSDVDASPVIASPDAAGITGN